MTSTPRQRRRFLRVAASSNNHPITGLVASLMTGPSALGASALGGFDLLFFSGQLYAAFAGEFGVSPSSLSTKTRGTWDVSVAAGPVFNMTSANQMNGTSANMYVPMSAAKYFALGIFGRSSFMELARNLGGTPFFKNLFFSASVSASTQGVTYGTFGGGNGWFGTVPWAANWSGTVSWATDFVPVSSLPGVLGRMASTAGDYIKPHFDSLGNDVDGWMRNQIELQQILTPP